MAYTRVNWEDLPSTNTPRNAANLNKMDAGIKENDDKLNGIKAMGSIVVDDVNGKNIINTGNSQIVLNNNGAERQGYYCLIPKTGTYYIYISSTNDDLYYGRSSDLSQATTAISSATRGTIKEDTRSFTAGEYFVIWGANTPSSTDKIMITLSDSAVPYSPYFNIIKEKDGCVKEDTTFYANDFKCKNLATFGYGSTTANQVTTTFDNSSFKINGTANASGFSFQKVVCTLPAGTYTLSTKLASGSKSGTSFQMTLVSDTIDYVTIPSNTTDRIATFTLTEETELKFRLYVNNTNSMTFNNMVINVQIEKGSVATTWTSFKEFDNVGKVLYDNATGTNNADIVLSDNTQNYSYFDFIINNTAAANNYLTIRIPANINRINLISYISGDANNLNIHYSVYHFNNEAKILYNWAGKVIFQGGAVTQSSGNSIYVKKIIGYK